MGNREFKEFVTLHKRVGAVERELIQKGCKVRGIKLCGALSAAALIAARLTKCLPDGEWEKYAVVTLIDCRKLLEPSLSSQHV
ncbi:Bifunctional protein pyrR, partial [Bienertia sinuspersici]